MCPHTAAERAEREYRKSKEHMKRTQLFFWIGTYLSLTAPWSSPAADLPMAKGPYEPTMESLTNYHCPDWFRNAKFGIWAHWGPQAVPMAGDWYARHMYVQGHAQYKDHLANFGHPSTNGYKDIIPLWKAEKWDPERLMALYKKAGAKYFVSMGSHHDNFFLWNSRLHRWNSVNMGPKRDVVGEWQKAAKKQGLRFGVSEHLGASFTWFQDSHKSDKTGPLAGVPYDGANPAFQDLYHFPAEPGDTAWYSNNPRWQRQWFDEIKELVDDYKPDLLYTDGGVPFGNEVGRSLIAHYYNANGGRNARSTAVIYTCKQKSGGRWVEDLERGVMPGINPYPWQTDTSIGDWYYNKNWKFRPVTWTIHMLADIVSKNGNLLLNVVQRPDGSLDPEVEQMLNEMAAWIKIHGEAIYDTRPWLVYGEGPVRAKGGSFKEDFGYTAQDVRFTTKGSDLYAIALGWPADGKLVIKSLAQAGDSRVKKVSLLGYKGRVTWTQTATGLVVSLPEKQISPYTCALRINGTKLAPAPISVETVWVQPDANGAVTLLAESAETHGAVGTEQRGGQTNLGFWDNAEDYVTWNVKGLTAGSYKVSACSASPNEGTDVRIQAGASELKTRFPGTGDWAAFKTNELGTIQVSNAGTLEIAVRPADAKSWKPVNLRWIKLVRQ